MKTPAKFTVILYLENSFFCVYSVYKNAETREQPTNEIHTLITVFMTKLVQFVSYYVKPIIVSFIGPLINKLHFTYQYSQVFL